MHAEAAAPEAARTILLLSNPIHTDIALPATPDVLKEFGFVSQGGLELDYSGVQWVIFGWGSRRFYVETPRWADLKPGPVVAALTLDSSVMHVARAGYIDAEAPEVRSLTLSADGFRKMVEAIRQDFAPGADGSRKAIEDVSYTAHDAFFPAKGTFNALNGCNTWTARMLRQAGLTTGWWTPLPQGLIWSIELHN
ncbi:TIGR02117 family protein [uncultured Roseibium sp.]|uniref:TIGR02117 family protein n=1 Tax=uncultured Roseibium sp. TaxID=1936171 RepID=UPI00374D8696